MQNSSAQEASLILAVRLLGVAFRTAQALSGGSSAPAFNVLREPRERLAPSHPLPRLPRRCTGRDSTRSWPRSRRGPGRGRTRRTGESALTAPLEPSFRNALSPVTCRPGEPRRSGRFGANAAWWMCAILAFNIHALTAWWMLVEDLARASSWKRTLARPSDPHGPPGRAWPPVDPQDAQGRDGRTAGSARESGRTIYRARIAPVVPVSSPIRRKRRASTGFCPAVRPRARIQALAANAVTSGRRKGQRITRRTAPGQPGNSASPTIRTETPRTAEIGGNWARHSLHMQI